MSDMGEYQTKENPGKIKALSDMVPSERKG